MTNFAGEITPAIGTLPSLEKVMGSLGLYLLVLNLIYFQNRFTKASKNLLLNLANLELLAFLAIFLFVLGGNSLFGFLFGELELFPSLLSLAIYFLGLGFFHYTYSRQNRFHALQHASQQLRLILPFALPYLFFVGILDLLISLPYPRVKEILFGENVLPFFLLSLGILALILVFFPPLIMKLWGCRPMQADLPLKKRLDELCKKANFKHGGLYDWTILNKSHTAAILGILPKWRYILFTKRLQDDLAYESIEAILAHEIGHSQRKHLIFYPFVLLGMMVCIGLFSLFGGRFIEEWFINHTKWISLYPLALFLSYAVIIWMYFRFVFGFFSRAFERQADLHCFELDMPPEQMIGALDAVAVATGFTHLAPNWHHYSIKERMDFLTEATAHPSLGPKHHLKVRKIIAFYLVILALSFGLFIYII